MPPHWVLVNHLVPSYYLWRARAELRLFWQDRIWMNRRRCNAERHHQQTKWDTSFYLRLPFPALQSTAAGYHLKRNRNRRHRSKNWPLYSDKVKNLLQHFAPKTPTMSKQCPAILIQAYCEGLLDFPPCLLLLLFVLLLPPPSRSCTGIVVFIGVTIRSRINQLWCRVYCSPCKTIYHIHVWEAAIPGLHKVLKGCKRLPWLWINLCIRSCAPNPPFAINVQMNPTVIKRRGGGGGGGGGGGVSPSLGDSGIHLDIDGKLRILCAGSYP